MLLRDPYKKTISLFAQVLQNERYMHIITSYVSNSAKLYFTHRFVEPIVNCWSRIVGNWERFISPKYLSTITSFTFYISILDWEIKGYHWTPILQNFWSRMHKERKQLVTWMPHHQLRVDIKFKLSSLSSPIHKKIVPNRCISFECPLLKFYLCKTIGDICKPILYFFQDLLV